VVDLNIIIKDYLKSPEYERLKQTHPELKLEISLEPELLGIAGSPVHLSKTVMNLVSNAAEALVDGGTVSITSENRYIDKPISGYDDIEEGDYVRLIVRDTGIGIAATDIERIFEPFYTKKAMGRSGTGLGMAVVWGTVKDHNGYIDVQSTEGRGTQFFIYLPACRRPSTSKTSRRPLDDYRGKGEFLLIVDDVKDQREIATGILTKLGYRVDAVSSGEAAVDYLKTRTADLLILDMIMDPGIDGLETYRRILELHPTQKAIIASGYSESERVKEAQKLGAGAYVKKPYLMEKMALAVREELDR
jgi:CheY-like chemotaxis protein